MQHVLITTSVPQTNCQIGRINRTLVTLLTKSWAPKEQKWYKYLEDDQNHLSLSPSRNTSTTPFHLLRRTHINMHENVDIRRLIQGEWTTTFQEERGGIRTRVRKMFDEILFQNRKSYDKKWKEATRHSQGDIAAIERKLELYQMFLVHYRVTREERNDRYVVQKIGEFEGLRTISTSVDNLKSLFNDWNGSLSEHSDSECENFWGQMWYLGGRVVPVIIINL